jgi:hypothetical protein
MKLKLIKDCKGGKSVMTIACQLGMSYSIAALMVMNKNKLMKAVKGPASWKQSHSMRLIEIQEGSISDVEKLLIVWIEDFSAP